MVPCTRETSRRTGGHYHVCLRREKCADHRSEEPSGRPVCLQVLSTISTVFNLPTRMNRELYICPMRWPQGGEAVLAGLRGDIMMCVCMYRVCIFPNEQETSGNSNSTGNKDPLPTSPQSGCEKRLLTSK